MKLAALAVAAIMVAACSSQPAASPPPVAIQTPAPTPEPVAPTDQPVVDVEVTVDVTEPPTEEPAAPETPAALVPVGTITRAGEWDVKVTGKANMNAWKVVKKANMFNEPAPKGWTMVLVPLQVWNRSGSTANLLGEMGYVVGNATGVEYTDFDDPTCGVAPKALDAFKDIRDGGTLKGNMCFVVENADLKTLRMGWPQGAFSDLPDIELAVR